MSYDPHDFIIEWRDIGAGCLLFAMALIGLTALGAPPGETTHAPSAHQTASAPTCHAPNGRPSLCAPAHAGRHRRMIVCRSPWRKAEMRIAGLRREECVDLKGRKGGRGKGEGGGGRGEGGRGGRGGGGEGEGEGGGGRGGGGRGERRKEGKRGGGRGGGRGREGRRKQRGEGGEKGMETEKEEEER